MGTTGIPVSTDTSTIVLTGSGKMVMRVALAWWVSLSISDWLKPDVAGRGQAI